MLFGNGMIHATNAALNERPEAFNRIRVAISAYVNLFRMANPRVVISRLSKHVIDREFVSVDRGRGQNTLDHVWHNLGARSVLDSDGHNFSATLNHSENG